MWCDQYEHTRNHEKKTWKERLYNWQSLHPCRWLSTVKYTDTTFPGTLMTKFGSCLYVGLWPSLCHVYIWDDDQDWVLLIHRMITKIWFCLYMPWVPISGPVYIWDDDQVWVLFIYGLMTKFGSCLYMEWCPSLCPAYIWADDQVWVLFIYGTITKFGFSLNMRWWPGLDLFMNGTGMLRANLYWFIQID